MEARILFAADALHVGAVYVEQDLGSDLHGDRFELTFTGGAQGTQLDTVIIDGDQNTLGLSLGDAIFDTDVGGLGGDNAIGLQIVSQSGIDDVSWYVEDGTSKLVLEFIGFDAGEKLVFSIDVDEIQEHEDGMSVAELNEGVDPITSGIEFQGSTLVADFSAEHFHDITATGEFRNRYDENFTGHGLDLPSDDEGGQRDRTAGAVDEVAQVPLPASIKGRVQISTPDGDCFGESTNHEPVSGVTVELLDQNGDVVATTVTNENGDYSFEDLLPGSYGIREIQPPQLIDGGENPGAIDGQTAGVLSGDDTVTNINLLGGQIAEDVSFCEHLPISLSGNVYHDRRNDGQRDVNDEGIADVTVQAFDEAGKLVAETVTDEFGAYRFDSLTAGNYTLKEIHPENWNDGIDTAGMIDGLVVGMASNPGDQIDEVILKWGDQGEEYNFGEFLAAAISGRVQLSTRDGDCFGETVDHEPVVGAVIQLLDADGQFVAETTTDANGEYHFDALPPGDYSLVEFTPEDLIDGGAQRGMVDGELRGNVTDGGKIQDISLSSGESAEQFIFCEHEPAKIGGFVYHDSDNDGIRDSNEDPIKDVTILLYDEDGNEVARTKTDENGQYEFDGLTPGIYSLEEIHPDDFIDGKDTPGRVNGGQVGVADNPGDRIKQIELGWGDDGEDFNFGELRPATLRGRVHSDIGPGDCIFDPESGDEALSRVTIQLLDANGQVVAETQTDQFGEYEFTDVAPGDYSIREIQPDGYFDGRQVAPEGKGDTSGKNLIANISVGSGEVVEELNFCEAPPATLRGIVHTDVGTRDCEFNTESGDELLAGVTVQLIDANGNTIDETVTNPFGEYEFTGLVAGEYSVREIQPRGYFNGGQSAPDGNGDTSGENIITGISVSAGEVVEELNFCEDPPALLSGYVFKDGDDIQLRTNEQLPERISELRDGQRTEDDTYLAGVAIELRDGITGLPISSDFVLPGFYADGGIRVVTDENGYYEFHGLRAGQYSVFQTHPSGFIDGVDTPGTSQGFVFNPGEPTSEAVLQSLEVEPLNDAIVRISLRPGQSSLEYNFSEVAVVRTTPPVPPPAPPAPPIVPPASPPVVILPVGEVLPNLPDFVVKDFGQMSTDVAGYTWHLSVIDAGHPRGEGLAIDERAEPIWFTSTYVPAHRDDVGRHLVNGQWFFERSDDGTPIRETSFFGISGGIPVAGDFNGDGIFEVAVFKHGEWFIDVNGNGIWDADDLWAKLGRHKKLDLPVAGDWDGDGKDDIGIFGPAWAGDPRAIALEPGLPDNENRSSGRHKNIPPSPAEATDGKRIMKLTNKGHLRGDVIDHVFHYGVEGNFPVVGDWNGDGIQAIGIFRNGQWNLDIDGNGRWTEADEFVTYGSHGDIPIVGDFNGDGIDEIGFFRGGRFHLDTNGNRELDDTDKVVELGRVGDFPVAGDFDGDGQDDVAVYRAVESPEQTQDQAPEPPTETVARKAG